MTAKNLVERLRERQTAIRRAKSDTLCLEAADEIERLQALMLAQTQLNTRMWQSGYDDAKRELTAVEAGSDSQGESVDNS